MSEAWLMGFGDVKENEMSIEQQAEQAVSELRAFGDQPISDEQRETSKQMILAYLRSQFDDPKNE